MGEVYQVVWRFFLGFIGLLIVVAFLVGAGLGSCSTRRTSENRLSFGSRCLGCGTEFVSDKPMKDVSVCPNCPLSEGEFNELKEAARNMSK